MTEILPIDVRQPFTDSTPCRTQPQGRQATRHRTPDDFIGRSAAAREVRELLDRLARVPFSALILTGETGTGKSLAARILHHSGARDDEPLVEINCAALPHELLESELFGHEAGAFTGARQRHIGLIEQADGGTLFLDEIGELDPELQSKLLQALEDRAIRRIGGERMLPIDVQIVAATNRDLSSLVAEGRFRSDLYHRLSVLEIRLPALRTRKADLADLVPRLVAEYNARTGRRVQHVPPAVWQRLQAYDWPGNVRELRNVIERCVLLADGDVLPVEWVRIGDTPATAPDFRKRPSQSGEPSSCREGDRLTLPLDGSMALEDIDRMIIRTALERHQHNIAATARALGSTRETLRYRIRKYGL